MAPLVYLLCGFASLLCTILLFRAYRATRASLLWWSTICFGGLTATNVALFADMILLPNIDLLPLRNCLSLASMLALIFGYFNDRN